jgi:hypothetical protein
MREKRLRIIKMTHDERRKKLRELHEEIRHLKSGCTHEVAVQKPRIIRGVPYYSHASCMGCSEDFGWYCPKSPDHVCHYFSDDDQVELITGIKVPIPVIEDYDHDPKYETFDSCLFCGHPDERK